MTSEQHKRAQHMRRRHQRRDRVRREVGEQIDRAINKLIEHQRDTRRRDAQAASTAR